LRLQFQQAGAFFLQVGGELLFLPLQLDEALLQPGFALG
jgi:hypothetical protein